MDGLVVSTDRLISSSEARSKFGKLLKDVKKSKGNYYVILENGKVTALLVNPEWLKDKQDDEFPDLEKLRSDRNRYNEDVAEAMESIVNMDEDDLPSFLK